MASEVNLEEAPEEELLQPVAKGSQKEIMDLSLMLSSQRVVHYLKVQEKEYIVEVHPPQADEIKELIKTYQKENKGFGILAAQPLEFTLAPFLLLFPVSFIFFAQSQAWNLNLTEFGRCDSELILGGEWWRLWTGLTLHADSAHYASNMLSGFLIMSLTLARMPWGLGVLAITLLSGLGNYFVALNALGIHRSIGFSTAVFCSLGILCTIQLLDNLIRKSNPMRTWAPLMAGVCILVFMGWSPESDVKAHVFGFIAGLVGSVPFVYLGNKLKDKALQWGFALASLGLLGVSWWLAL